MTPRSMDVLVYLAERAGEIVNGQELLDAFWGDAIASDHAIHKAVAELRKALGDSARNPTYIKTVPKRGYCLIAEVKSDPTRAAEIREDSTKSIAVLPFKNIDGNPENQFLVEGIAEALLDGLAKLPNLRVAARTDSFNHSGENESTVKIAKVLGVDHLLEGSVQRSNGKLRVTTQLIRASDGFHLYSDRFDVEAADIFAVQDEVANNVITALRVHLDDAERAQMLDWGTTDVDAYLISLEGWFHCQQYNVADLERATELFQSAIDLDPNYMRAYYGKAISINDLCYYSSAERIDELREVLGTLHREVARIQPDSEILESIKAMELRTNGAELVQLESQLRKQIMSEARPAALSNYAKLLIGARLYAEAMRFLDRTKGSAEEIGDMRVAVQGPHTRIRMRNALLIETPDHVGLLTGHVVDLAIIGDYKQAEVCFRHLEQRDSDSAKVWSGGTGYLLSLIRGDLPPGSDALEAVLCDDPADMHHHICLGALCFGADDIERGAHYWRNLPTVQLRMFSHMMPVFEYTGIFAQGVCEDPRYHALLEEMGLGKSWQRLLMEGVMQMEPVTDVKLSDRAREHYEADRLMIPAEPLSD